MMIDPDMPSDHDDFERRLRAAREREDKTTGRGPKAEKRDTSGLGLAMRIGVELVAAVVIGAGIGYGLDRWLGTMPWFMVLFLLLGGAAGVMNVYRTMQGMDQTVGLGRAQRDARHKPEQDDG